MKKLVCIGLLVALFVACSERPQTKTEYAIVDQDGRIKNYGNNVYYFDFTSIDEFGTALSNFSEEHKELEREAIASYDGGGGRGTLGYFVTFCKKK